MSAVDLNEKLLMEIAGWEAVKLGRALVEQGKVLSSNWSPPILRGVIQDSATSYRAGLIIKSRIDVENLCTCRQSREWGTICSHSVAVGLHHLNRQNPVPNAPSPRASRPPGVSAAPLNAAWRNAGAGGPEARLFIIFPPNLLHAIEKDKITLFLEAECNGRRTPLNAFRSGQPVRFSAGDHAILETVETLAGAEAPSMLMLSGALLAELLPRLSGHPNLSLGKSRQIEVSPESLRPRLSASLEDSGEILLRLQAIPGGAALKGKELWTFDGEAFRKLPIPAGYEPLLKAAMRLARAQVPNFVGRDWELFASAFEVEAGFRPEDFVFEPQPPKFLLHLAGGLAQLQAHLQCAYGPRIMTVGVTDRNESLWLPDAGDPRRYSTRDWPAEQRALGRLARNGFAGPDAQGRLQLLGQDRVIAFFAREFPRLEKEWTVTLEERLERSAEKNFERIEPRLEITSSGVSWFDLDVGYVSPGGVRVSSADIQRLLRSGQTHSRLPNGKLALLDVAAVEELQQTLQDCSPRQHDGRYRIDAAQAAFLDSTVREQGNWRIAGPNAWRERVQQQLGAVAMECPPLGTLDEVLRPYQKSGVAWLHFLRENRFGGILADEMGLGKTLQALAFLCLAPGRSKPAMVVCPTSLVFNWVAEARKFAPHLRVLALSGGRRAALFEQIPNHDLIVTSYALIRRDAGRYRDLEFDTVILDEAQHIKNRQTQNAQAVKNIRSDHRLVLTGTPLENSVLDLWSIFDFLMPGYLGLAGDFRERYEIPVTRDKDAAARGRLSRRIRPFLLRRLKSEVAAELPEKIEQVSFCELTEAQRALYRQVIEGSRMEILNTARGPDGTAQARMMALNALLRLRQICCDLRLLKLEGIDPATASGKLDLFGELIQEVIDGGHRALVFSQFTSMLALLKERLMAEEIPFCYLDGSTRDRGAVVERFQKEEGIPVFLISLKAGGVGLNLTGADTVIHFDPWWNPAVEDQATDRAHRIGQARIVTSYKLIARGTVEEKILSLQSRKRELVQAMLSGDEELAGRITWEEIQELFE